MIDEVNHGAKLISPAANPARVEFCGCRVLLTAMHPLRSRCARSLLVSSRSLARARARRLIVANGIVVTMDGERRVISTRFGRYQRHTIVGVGPADRIAQEFKARDTIDARRSRRDAGLINTHTHAPMVLYRGLGDDLALMDWLQKYIFPAEAKTVSPAFVRTGTHWPRSR